MPSFTKPSPEHVRDFLHQQATQPFSYAEVGASRGDAPAGYNHDHYRARLGQGERTFDAACAALRRWAHFPRPWTDVQPADAALVPGQAVAVPFRAMGLWWLNACRIVYVIDEAQPIRRFGFAYGTLPAHAERGEERFSVEQHADGSVWYDLFAFSRPRIWLARLGYPISRRYQRRFGLESLAAMQAIADGVV